MQYASGAISLYLWFEWSFQTHWIKTSAFPPMIEIIKFAQFNLE